MQVFRQAVEGFAPRSALRELFCVWRTPDGVRTPLVTLDITLWQRNGGETYAPQHEGAFIDAPVQIWMTKLGTISQYVSPSSTPGLITPMVVVEPESEALLDVLPNWSASGVVAKDDLKADLEVTVLSQVDIPGIIRELAVPRTYPEPGCEALTMLLKLSTSIVSPSVFGAPVVLAERPDRLVGMLLTGQVDPQTGYTYAQCYPAYDVAQWMEG